MTHDEIAQLDAAQLRLEVARVKGWTFWDSLDHLGPWVRHTDPREAYYAGGIPLNKCETPDANKITWDDENDPNWPADIAAAMGLFLELPLPRRIHQEDGTFYVLCGGRSYGPSTDMEMDFYAEVDEEGEPNALCVAICRAYLMWKQG